MTGPEVSPRPTRPGALAGLAAAARFVSELALVAGAAWAASTRPRTVVLAMSLGIAAALAVAAVWGAWIAPSSRRRLADPFRLVLEVALFVVVSAGLAAVGHPPAAVILAVLGVAAAVAVRFVPPPTPRMAARAEERVAPPTPADAPLRRPRGRDRGRRGR